MRRPLGLLCGALFAVSLTACSSSDDGTTINRTPASAAATPDGRAANTEPSAPAANGGASSAPSSGPAAPGLAKVGDALELRGMDEGEQVTVTLVKVVDPAQAEDDWSTPDAGERFVSLQFRIVNTSNQVYADSPSNGIRVIDSEGQQFSPSYHDSTAGPALDSPRLTPGSTALGFVTFEVPESAQLAKVQFAMNSGFSHHLGEWALT